MVGVGRWVDEKEVGGFMSIVVAVVAIVCVGHYGFAVGLLVTLGVCALLESVHSN